MDNNSSKEFKPFIPADKIVPEFTATSIILGVILAVIFGGANAYLGLRVGMTVSASIPAAVISMGVIRVVLRKDSILENNMVQTIGSAGESLAAGAIFTLPAIFMWAEEGKCENPSFITIAIIALCGGFLGVLFMVPLRTALIVEEHGILPYPEGTACAEVLLAGEEGGDKSKVVFAGLGISAAYKFIADGLKLFPSSVNFDIYSKNYTCGIGMDVLPALAGVGYICGLNISSYMFAGGILSYLVLIPAISFFGGDAASSILDDAGNAIPFNQLDPGSIWSQYIRYIGAGAVAAGGILSLIKSLPTMVKTFGQAIKGFGKNVAGGERTQQDISMKSVIIGVVLIAIIMWLVPAIPISPVGAAIVVIFGFFFATVSSRMVGIVGSSNNPVSGMAIATLILTTVVFKSTGMTGTAGMVAAITVGTVICIIAAIAGDTSQDLKCGYIVGATPKKQQIGEMIGAFISAFAIGGVMYLLNAAWGFGSEAIPAPQASLMKMIVEGVMGGTLPWTLIFIGVFMALAVEVIGIPVLAFAVGLYLPIHMSAPIYVGGLIKWYVEDKKKYDNEKQKRNSVEAGILYSSGLIAGEGLVGILLAVLAVVNVDFDMSGIYGDSFASVGNWVGLAVFAGLLATLIFCCRKKNIVEIDTKEEK
ncbi:MAG: oligopeptide transporter, OPT family [Eubacteriales bacterium]|nr:oligopeptide transporter, OPT family [Eubacteriales bacterium]